MTLDNTQVSQHLGKTSSYKATYDKSLLVRELRQNNRDHLGIDHGKLPFVGFDVWNAYEVSCLLDNGVPIAAYAKIVYPCDNEYIVESKSIKLYLNSFNMETMGPDFKSAKQGLQETISEDLTELLGVTVLVHVYSASQQQTIHCTPNSSLHNYQTLEEIVDISKLTCDTYQEQPLLLRSQTSEAPVVQKFHSALLKSNCRVTSQPDWGDVYIHMVGKEVVSPASLLQYIVSFRGENHFHEEIIETIYVRLQAHFSPDQLAVYGFYVRRGGIDINPVRASSQDLLSSNIVGVYTGCFQSSRQ